MRPALVGVPRADRDERRAALTVRARAGEEALVRRAKAGSRAGAAELFELHWPAARRAALAITGDAASADDIAQDAFERAFSHIEAFDEGRPFGPWLHRIVVNRAIDLVRARRRLVSLEEAPAAALILREAPEPGDGELLSVVACLSPERRAVVVLRYLLDYRPPEIADLLDLPLGTVNSRLGRALAELRAILGEDS